MGLDSSESQSTHDIQRVQIITCIRYGLIELKIKNSKEIKVTDYLIM